MRLEGGIPGRLPILRGMSGGSELDIHVREGTELAPCWVQETSWSHQQGVGLEAFLAGPSDFSDCCDVHKAFTGKTMEGLCSLSRKYTYY